MDVWKKLTACEAHLMTLFPTIEQRGEDIREQVIFEDLLLSLPHIQESDLLVPLADLTPDQIGRLEKVRSFIGGFRQADNGVIHEQALAHSILRPALCSIVPSHRVPLEETVKYFRIVAGSDLISSCNTLCSLRTKNGLLFPPPSLSPGLDQGPNKSGLDVLCL